MKDFSRSERLGDEFRNELSKMILREVHDPRLSSASITAVDISDCLTFARVYWVLISAEQPAERELKRVQRAFDKASGFFRSQLAERMPQRTVPELRFVFDESIERGRRMEAIVASLKEDDSSDSE